MNSFYAACDCGWKSKKFEDRESAREAGKIHLDYAHRTYDVVMFQTSAEPDA